MDRPERGVLAGDGSDRLESVRAFVAYTDVEPEQERRKEPKRPNQQALRTDVKERFTHHVSGSSVSSAVPAVLSMTSPARSILRARCAFGLNQAIT
jgi:hypothetical protein